MFEEFKKVSKEEWASKATSDLKGEDVYSKYNWQLGSLLLSPYYDSSDLDKIKSINEFSNRLAISADPSGDVRIWKNIQCIHVKDAKKANAEALGALFNGADGINFNLHNSDVDLKILLNDILPEYCHISFCNATNSVFENVISYFQSGANKNITVDFADKAEIDFTSFLKSNAVEGIRFINIRKNNCNSFEEEVAGLLQDCNTQIRLQLIKGIEIQKIVDALIIHTNIGTDFFGEIAKIRAIRNLIYQIFRAYGLENSAPEDVKIECLSTAWSMEDYNPHANMLKGSTAAMAAILGGCDMLIVEPEKEELLHKRIARNVSSILKEESYLSKVADPVAGSYFIESLTDELSKKSWALFQNEFENQKSASTI